MAGNNVKEKTERIDRVAEAPDAQGHTWWNWHGIICCSQCGIVKRMDGVNKPCPGVVKIGPR